MNAPAPTVAEARARFRRTLVRVLTVEAVTLALLGLFQIVYTP